MGLKTQILPAKIFYAVVLLVLQYRGQAQTRALGRGVVTSEWGKRGAMMCVCVCVCVCVPAAVPT